VVERGQHSRPQTTEEEAPDHSAGLVASVKETRICIVDDTGRFVREVKMAIDTEAMLLLLTNPGYRFERVSWEAGPLSQWVFCTGRGRLTGDLCRVAAHPGSSILRWLFQRHQNAPVIGL
jgi:hypothetical protein